jgi:ubiquinone/menaquinone biosynthesis C-methylase UbiE
MPLTDEFVTKDKIGTEFLLDINIVICKDCLTVQTQQNINTKDYYKDYQYSVRSSIMASTYMDAVSCEIKKKYFSGKKSLKVLEIGSGDGRQLQSFKKLGCDILGYEPSAFLSDIANKNGINTIHGFFDDSSINKLPKEFKSVDILLLTYTFDHLPDPVSFLRTSKQILNDKSGLIFIEVHDLEKIFNRREYCLFEHEHSIYLTRATAQALMDKFEYYVINFDIVPENIRRANSLIFIATPKDSVFSYQRLDNIELLEYRKISFYKGQANKIRNAIENIDKFLEMRIRQRKKVAGYGSGGRGVMSLAAIKNTSMLQYLVDKNPKGKSIYTPKSNVPVFSIDKIKEDPVDEVIVFSYGYMNEIQEELKKFGYKSEQFHSLIDILSGNWN